MSMIIAKIRLGSKCNQHCSWCHSSHEKDYEFNPKLIPYIKYSEPKICKLNYGGGEPLIYWDRIKFFINTFPNLWHHIVTNGSLINEEVLEYSKKYRLRIGVSLNEFTNISEKTYKLIAQIPELGVARIYTGDYTLDELDERLDEFNSHLGGRQICADYNLMHTNSNNDKAYTEEQKDYFIKEIDKRIERSLIFMKNGLCSKYDHMVMNYINLTRLIHSQRKQNPKVPGCCHYNFKMISLDGRLMDCPYDESYRNDIEDIYNERIPELNKNDCMNCPMLFGCVACYKNNNDMECKILNEIIERLKSRFKEFDITFEEYLANLKSRNVWFTNFDYKSDD